MIAGGPERRLSARPLWLPAKTGGWGEGGAMLDPFGGGLGRAGTFAGFLEEEEVMEERLRASPWIRSGANIITGLKQNER